MTDATGTGSTVTVAVPVFPSLVASIITGPPTATADASPVPLTCATVELLVDQVTERPRSGLPLASAIVAANCVVRPTMTLAEAGLTNTAATGSGPMEES